jgi:hypothetical protein
MDHLPSGLQPLVFQAPYICTEDYKHDGKWVDYPARKGINIMHIRYESFRYYDRERIGSFLQNWLFFGLLQDVFDIKCDANTLKDFVRKGKNGQKFLSTSELPKYLEVWQQRVKDISDEEKFEMYHRINATMQEAARYTYWLGEYPSVILSLNPEPLMSREAALSLALLGHYLEGTTRKVLNSADESTSMVWSSGYLFLEHMEIQGWCPFLVTGLEWTLSLRYKCLAAQLGPPRVQRNHSRCSDDHCAVPKPSKVQHVVGNCGCASLSPDIKSVVDIIDSETTPLLRFQTDDSDQGRESSLELLRDDSHLEYVAVSHVWTDGLGNENDNSLSECQLRRIQTNTNSMFSASGVSSHPFWMDTLLIPQGHENEATKKKALNRMSMIYKNAAKVLVIDSEIVASCSMDSSATHILLHIHLSNWLRRLWTHQEGLFARSIHFLVSDGTVSCASLFNDEVSEGLVRELRPVFGRSLGHLFYTSPDRITDIRPSQEELFEKKPEEDANDDEPQQKIWEGKVTEMIREVQKRTSTFTTDEALCIGFLLDIDPSAISEIVRTKFEKKNAMPVLLKALNKSIPPCIIFLKGERLEESGLRWAPKSFLVGQARDRQRLNAHEFGVPDEWPHRMLMVRPSGELDPQGRGLKLMFPGIHLGRQRTDDPLSDRQFLVDVSTGANDEEVTEDGKPPLVWRITYSKDKADRPWKEISPKKDTSEKMAIIIGSYGPDWYESATGVLVQLREDTETYWNETVFVRRVCLVIVSAVPKYDNFSWQKAPSKRISGHWRPVTQMWCVD